MARLVAMVIGCVALFFCRASEGKVFLQAPPALEELPEEILLAEEVDDFDSEEEQQEETPQDHALEHPDGSRSSRTGGGPPSPGTSTALLLKNATMGRSKTGLTPSPNATAAATRTGGRESLYPITQEFVAKALDEMPKDLDDLAKDQFEQKKREQAVEAFENSTLATESLGFGLRRKISKLEARLAADNHLLKRLKKQKVHLFDEKRVVSAKFKATVGPRIALHSRRVTEEKKRLEAASKEWSQWKEHLTKSKAAALKAVQERKSRATDLKVAGEAVARAERAEEEARSAYQKACENVVQNIEEYNAAKTRFKAETSKLQEAKIHVKDSEKALSRMQMLYNLESQRLQHKLEAREKKVERFIEKEKTRVGKVLESLAASKSEYRSWQEQRRKLVSKVSSIANDLREHQTSFDAARLRVLRAANEKVGKEANEKSHWDANDWAWTGGGDGFQTEKGMEDSS